MIASLLPAAYLSAHIGCAQTVNNRRTEEQMVDPQARVPRPCVSEVIPESVDAFTRMKRPHRIGPALFDQTMKRLTDLGPEQRIIDRPFAKIKNLFTKIKRLI